MSTKEPTYLCVGTKTWIKCPVHLESAIFVLYFLKFRTEAKFKDNEGSFVLPLVISFLLLVLLDVPPSYYTFGYHRLLYPMRLPD